MNKILGHLKTIIKHKHYVFLNCCKAGLYWRGIKHDMSKFHPIEFCESVKYFTGTRSPIDLCKEENGYSAAWMHHKGRNSHHYEYWVDYLDDGGKPVQMPYKDALEMICDYIAAGRAYKGKDFSYADEYDGFWKLKKSKPIKMHDQTKAFVDMMLLTMKLENSNDVLRRSRSYRIYKQIEREVQ